MNKLVLLPPSSPPAGQWEDFDCFAAEADELVAPYKALCACLDKLSDAIE